MNVTYGSALPAQPAGRNVSKPVINVSEVSSCRDDEDGEENGRRPDYSAPRLISREKIIKEQQKHPGRYEPAFIAAEGAE